MDILTAIRNATGPRPALFVPEVSFELLVKRQIRRLEEPSIRCIELVHEEMQRIIQHCGNEVQQEMLRFPRLHEKIIDVVTNLLRSRLPPTNSMVENIVAVELAYINTKHPDFHKDAVLAGSAMNSNDRRLEHASSVGSGSVKGGAKRPLTIHYGNTQQPALVNGDDKENKKSESTGTWLNNILPAPKNDSETSAARSESPQSSKSETGTGRTTPTSGNPAQNAINTPQKPVNLLPEVPSNASRKLTDREQRDCEVIGKDSISIKFDLCCWVISCSLSERLIKSYFYIVRKGIQDSVPKMIRTSNRNDISRR